MFQVVPVVAAVASALTLGLSAVIEQRGTKRVQPRRTVSPRLLADLFREPLWLAGIAANLLGFGLQVVALNFGALALVEPILTADLIFAALISAALRRQWDPVILGGVLACAVGVSGFLVIAQPSGGLTSVGLVTVLPLFGGLAAALAGCLALARLRPSARPLALALACGIDYGVAAFVVKLITAEFSGGPAPILTHWPIYALAVVGPLGFLLNQEAFQAGTLIAPVLAVITVCDPIVSIGLAFLFLHERFAGGPAGGAGAAVALLLMTGGIFVLAHRSPIAVRHMAESSGQGAGTVSRP